MALHEWNSVEWEMAFDALEANGVDIADLLEKWGTSTNPAENDVTWPEDSVVLTQERHDWVVGVLGGDDAFDPQAIPD